MKIKNTLFTLLFVFGITFGNYTSAQRSVAGNISIILSEISALGAEFNLTNRQKAQMRSILMGYLPSIALKASAMLNNRKNLLALSVGEDMLDENYLLDIAEKQGQLLTSLIVIKEHLKKDIRIILTEDQKQFVDEIIQTIIQHRLTG